MPVTRRSRAPRQQIIELVQLRFDGIVVFEFGRAFQLADDRI